MDDDMNRPSRADWYMAQLALEIYRSVASKKARARNVKDYLLKFKLGDKSETEAGHSPSSHSVWRRIFGMKKES